MFSSFCHSSSLKVAKPPLGADDAPTTLTRMSMPTKTRSDFIDYFRASRRRAEVGLNKYNSLSHSDRLSYVGLRAVVMTLAPPSRSRLTTALPIPAVPPVTRTRFPLNSFAINGNLVAIMIIC